METSRWQQRLEAIRRKSFIGRQIERDLFLSALQVPEFPFLVLYLYGPGGVGKTTLIRQFSYLAHAQGTQVLHLDARNIDPTPDIFTGSLRQQLTLEPSKHPADYWAESAERHVLFLDTYELLAPLDEWLRDVFLPTLPENVLTVLAGRSPPKTGWREDPAWQELTHIMALDNLSPAESRAYLNRREIPLAEHEKVLQFTHGHPLALSLVADVFANDDNAHFQPEKTSDIISMLVERLVLGAPGPAYREALEASALVRVTTESLLKILLDRTDVEEIFAWLRDLSLMEVGPRGIFPHDLAREALAADVHWRKPAWYAALHGRARTYYLDQLEKLDHIAQQRLLLDYIFLHRENPMVRPFFIWQSSGLVFPDRVSTDDYAQIADLIGQFEGESAAEIARHWLQHSAAQVVVMRGSGGSIAGVLIKVAVEQTTAADHLVDAVVGAAFAYLKRQVSLRSGETATYFRFWLACDTYQDVSATQSRIFLTIVQHYLTTAGLAFSFLPCAHPDFWNPIFEYADMQHVTALDFEIDGHRHGVYVRDWRVSPPPIWLDMMAARELAGNLPPAAPAREKIVILSEKEFGAAVKEALRQLNDGAALQQNPLLNTQVCRGQEAADPVTQLQTLLKDSIDSLQQTPRQRKLHRALYHTYVQPTPSQELAAELLDVPFSSFRRHLTQGIKQITTVLWQLEIAGGRIDYLMEDD